MGVLCYMWYPRYNHEVENGCGIYTITNLVNRKMYVGLTTSFTERRSIHFTRLRAKKHDNIKLQRSFNKYGEDSFLFEILVECKEEFLHSEEHYWCNMLNVHDDKYGYNIKPTHPYGNPRMAESTKKKLSEIRKGIPFPEHLKYHLKELNTGIKISEEHKKKISEGLKKGGKCGHKHTPETLQILKERKLGKKQSSEHIERRISKIRGRKQSQEEKDRRTAAMLKTKSQRVYETKGKEVIQCTIDGKIIKEWKTATQIVKELGYCSSDISEACHNKRKTGNEYKGYIWKFKN